MSSRASARPRNKYLAEDLMIKKREKEHLHRLQWGNQVQYYKGWEKANNKFEEWTSPRYYKSNNEMIENLKKECDKKKQLEKRREKLQQLIAEENKSYEIELMVKNRYKYLSPRTKPDEIPTELLKDVNLGIKMVEDDRKRHEAEINLYHQWRNNNPIVREHERGRNNRNLKLSWLDQQIEKRMQKEKSEEDCRRMLAERNKLIQEAKAQEEALQRETEEKNKRLKEDLEKQMDDLKIKQQESEKLKTQENEERRLREKLAEFEEKQKDEDSRRLQQECAIFNIRQHKMKLKQKALDVQENLLREKQLLEQLRKSELAENIEDKDKKQEVRQTISEFLKIARDQQCLEKQRQKYLDFVFDSEAKVMYEKQQEIWENEQKARQQLLHDVLDTIKNQISQKAIKNKERQREILEERQKMLRSIEDYDLEMQRNKADEERRIIKWKKDIDLQVKEKCARKKEMELLEQKKIDAKLEAARREEQRLKKEIMDLQRRQGPIRPSRSRILF